jgi:hypothetical protein
MPTPTAADLVPVTYEIPLHEMHDPIQLFNLFKIIAVSKPELSDSIGDMLSFVDRVFPAELFTESVHNYEDENSPINLFQRQLLEQLSPIKRQDFGYFIMFKAALATHNAALVENCHDQDILYKCFNQIFNKLLIKYGMTQKL